MIEVTDLYKAFDGTPVLKGVNMCVNKGSIYGLLGRNGVGKTTLIQHLAGVYRQDSGKAVIDGEEIYENVKVKLRSFFLFDEPYAFPAYTIKGMAKFYQRMYPRWNSQRYHDMLADFSLDEKVRFARLSKGMKKQAAFLLALSATPEFLVMDEPMDGIDPIMRKKIWNWIIEDVSQRQMTVLISSHNLRELEGICDTIGIMKDGFIELEMDIDQVKEVYHKVQIARKNGSISLPSELEVLHRQSIGSVQLFVIRGEKEELLPSLERLRPDILEVVPLTLEELFIYILGGDSDEEQA